MSRTTLVPIALFAGGGASLSENDVRSIVRPLTLAVSLAFSLAGCGGGGGGGSASPPVSAVPAPMGSARFVLTVPKSTTSSAKRAPRYISPSTQSAAITAGGVRTVVSLVASNPNCAQGAGGLVCTVEAPVPVGTSPVSVSTYAGTDASGTPLSTVTMNVTVVSGTVTTVDLTLNGVVASLAVAVSPPALVGGTASTASVTVNARDASGQTIVGPGGYADANGNPVTVTLSDSDTSGATHLSATTLTGPTSGITLSYDGAPISSFTITASTSAAGIAPASATVSVGRPSIFIGAMTGSNSCLTAVQETVTAYQVAPGGGVGPATGSLDAPPEMNNAPPGSMTIDRSGDLFVLDFLASGTSILKYPLGATGSPSPSASISGQNTGLVRAVRIAADASGGVWAAEPAVNGNPAQLQHFAAGANGTNVSPDRTVTGIAGLPPTWTFDANGLAVDSHDDVYTTALDPNSHDTRVYVLPPASNGVASPIGSYQFVRAAAIERVAVDQHSDSVWAWPADVHAMGFGTPGGTINYPSSGVVQFAAGSPTASRAFWGLNSFPSNVQGIVVSWIYAGIAFDDAGNAYVQYEVLRDGGYCQHYVSVFGPGQSGDTAPLQNTNYGVTVPIGIAIPVASARPSASGGPGVPSSAISASPSSLSFLASGANYAQRVTVSEPGYGGSWSATSANTAIATVVPAAAPNAFTVTPVNAGNTTITVRDGSGSYATVSVTVSITGLNLHGVRR